jgi:hypothetical protein
MHLKGQVAIGLLTYQYPIRARGFRVDSKMLSNRPLPGWARDHFGNTRMAADDKVSGLKNTPPFVKAPTILPIFGSGRKILKSMKPIPERHPNTPE